MPCGWEVNSRSGVALAMRHRLQWFIHACRDRPAALAMAPMIMGGMASTTQPMAAAYDMNWARPGDLADRTR